MKERRKKGDWLRDPATEKQIAYLRSVGVAVEPGLTKGRASQLIGGEPTMPQLRRLAFYGISADGVTKEGASELIDDYLADHPESESAYQAWKQSASITQIKPVARSWTTIGVIAIVLLIVILAVTLL